MSETIKPAPFIRGSWYPASWSNVLDREPVRRRFLDEDIVLYRAEEGNPVALANACPHRFAPLSQGRLHGNSIACPYHGLRFSPDGQCSHNPHGPIPKSVRVRSYPLTEKYGMIWIWMGEPNNADPSKLPPIGVREDSRFDWVSGYLHVAGDYQLVVDNLSDLSHVEFMHPFLANIDDRPENLQIGSFEDGEQVVTRYYRNEIAASQLVTGLWDDAPEHISLAVEMRWNAPANLIQESRFDVAEFDVTEEAEQCKGQLLTPFCHLLTPETASTTHYFWAAGRNMKTGIPEVSKGMELAIEATFKGEDEPMIADIQSHIGDRELFDLKPLLLSIDKSAVLARRRISARIAQEAEAVTV